MACTEVVIDTLRPLQKARQSTLLANRVELIAASRENLVRICLVTSVDHNLVVRRVVHVVQGHSQFNSTKARPKVSADTSDRVDKILAHFVADATQLRFRKLAQVFRSID